ATQDPRKTHYTNRHLRRFRALHIITPVYHVPTFIQESYVGQSPLLRFSGKLTRSFRCLPSRRAAISQFRIASLNNLCAIERERQRYVYVFQTLISSTIIHPLIARRG
ncbi:hypothetical protein M9Y53_17535, partial [Klebsiella pneumoniae]